MYASIVWDAGNVSRKTNKGYRTPKDMRQNIVIKPKKFDSAARKAARIMKGHGE